MECNFDKTILHEFIDNSIEPLEMIFLSEHIKHCKSCEEELNMLYKTDKKLKSFYNKKTQYPNRLDGIGKLVIENLSDDDEVMKGLKEVIMENSSRFIKLIPGALRLKNSIGRTYKNIRNRDFNFYQLKNAK